MQSTVSVVGLGYVGLPVAVAFGKQTRGGRIAKTIGFDINRERLEDLKRGVDTTLEVDRVDLQSADIHFTDNIGELRQANFHIVAIPTPVNEAHQPDLGPLFRATETVGRALKKGDVVVYESTVYPGVTEEECAPILERASGLKCGVDFKIGYSPERTNPGDRNHSFTNVRKVVSGMDAETLDVIATMYESVVTAGVVRVPSIKIAEAAKVIENTQRDLNIAFMNELVLILDKMGIRATDVIDVASTKWNFLKFTPGLVGGHCIGVDPYYLTYKAEKLGYVPQVILAGRRINDGMGTFIAQRMIKELIHTGHAIRGSVVTILGLSFKENVPDLRNSRVFDIIRELKDFGVDVQVHDPLADANEAEDKYGVRLTPFDSLLPANGVIAAVSHNMYRELPQDALARLFKPSGVLVDIKTMFKQYHSSLGSIRVWYP